MNNNLTPSLDMEIPHDILRYSVYSRAIRFNAKLPKEHAAAAAADTILELNFDITDSKKTPRTNLTFLRTINNIEYYSLNLVNPHLLDFSKNKYQFNLQNDKTLEFVFVKTSNEDEIYRLETLLCYK